MLWHPLSWQNRSCAPTKKLIKMWREVIGQMHLFSAEKLNNCTNSLMDVFFFLIICTWLRGMTFHDTDKETCRKEHYFLFSLKEELHKSCQKYKKRKISEHIFTCALNVQGYKQGLGPEGHSGNDTQGFEYVDIKISPATGTRFGSVLVPVCFQFFFTANRSGSMSLSPSRHSTICLSPFQCSAPLPVVVSNCL